MFIVCFDFFLFWVWLCITSAEWKLSVVLAFVNLPQGSFFHFYENALGVGFCSNQLFMKHQFISQSKSGPLWIWKNTCKFYHIWRIFGVINAKFSSILSRLLILLFQRGWCCMLLEESCKFALETEGQLLLSCSWNFSHWRLVCSYGLEASLGN